MMGCLLTANIERMLCGDGDVDYLCEEEMITFVKRGRWLFV